MNDTSYIDQYREHGYAIVRGVFGAEDVARMAAGFDRMADYCVDKGANFRQGNVLVRVQRDGTYGLQASGMQWPSYLDEELAAVRRDPRICRLLEPLIGKDLKQIINQLHWKPPSSDERSMFSYHQDVRSRKPVEIFRNLATSYVQIGIAVDAQDRENGCLRVYPDSHVMGDLGLDALFHKHRHELERPEDVVALAGLDPDRFVDVIMEPGDVALWAPYTIHGSAANHSERLRRLYINGYVKAEDGDWGHWAFRDGEPCELGEPVLVQYPYLHEHPEPQYLESGMAMSD